MSQFTKEFVMNGVMLTTAIAVSTYLGMKLYVVLKVFMKEVQKELQDEYDPIWPNMYRPNRKKEKEGDSNKVDH